MEWYLALDTVLTENLPDLTYLHNEPMARHTSLKIGGPATRMACPSNAEQLVLCLSLSIDCGVSPLVIGKGSNLLVDDLGLDTLVIDTTGMLETLTISGNCIHASAGFTLSRLADFAQKHSLTGLEFAHGIPGTLGGGIVMNAGAYGGELCQVVASVTVLHPQQGILTLTREQMHFSYRHSLCIQQPDLVVLGATLCLTPGDSTQIRGRMDELIAKRKDKQPLEFPSAGSTFKRPVGHFAGALIEQCGLKGFTVGGAQVSEKHAGFVINRGGATCADMLLLMETVSAKVLAETEVVLEPEVRILNQN